MCEHKQDSAYVLGLCSTVLRERCLQQRSLKRARKNKQSIIQEETTESLEENVLLLYILPPEDAAQIKDDNDSCKAELP